MSEQTPVIAIDVMGGDFGPSVVVHGALKAALQDNFSVILVGDKKTVEQEVAKSPYAAAQYDIAHASEVALIDRKSVV